MRASYSYRDDPTVPDFDDAAPVAFMDGDCALCSFGARMIDRLDPRGDIRICPVATPLGQAMLRHCGLRANDPESWLCLEDGRVWRDFDATARVGLRSGGWGRLLGLLLAIRRPVRTSLYARFARNRYAVFGRTDLCAPAGEPGGRARRGRAVPLRRGAARAAGARSHRALSRLAGAGPGPAAAIGDW